MIFPPKKLRSYEISITNCYTSQVHDRQQEAWNKVQATTDEIILDKSQDTSQENNPIPGTSGRETRELMRTEVTDGKSVHKRRE